MARNHTTIPVMRFDPSLSDPNAGLFGSGLGIAGMAGTPYARVHTSHDRTPQAFRSGMLVVACDHRGRFAAVALVQTEGRQVHQGLVETRRPQKQFVEPTLLVLRAGQAVCPHCVATYAATEPADDAELDPACGTCAAKLARLDA